MNWGKQILQNLGSFSEEEISLFESKVIKRNLKKGALLLKEGDVCVSAFYILSGAVYQFIVEDITENIVDLHIDRDWCLNHASFVGQKPSRANIKAYSDVDVLELKISTIHDLAIKHPAFFQLGKILELSLSRLEYYDRMSSAEEKHHHLIETKPELFQKFPLKMIASYLKISPETISRIRARK